MLRFILGAVLMHAGITSAAEAKTQPAVTYKMEKNIAYRPSDGNDAYRDKWCCIDLYYPENVDSFKTVVWFHGGGLKNGWRFVPTGLKERGVAVAAAGYRLSPTVKTEVCLDDAAASVAWVLKNIGRYGGDPGQVYVSGHSAGGYLAYMVGLDSTRLQKHGARTDQLAGLFPVSGQVITHSTVRAEQGVPRLKVIVDDMAPLNHVQEHCPPCVIITGDRELESWGRYEENALMARFLKLAGHEETVLHELDGFTHGNIVAPAGILIGNILSGKDMKR